MFTLLLFLLNFFFVSTHSYSLETPVNQLFSNYLFQSSVQNFTDSVTIGFLGAYGQAQVVLGALPIAIEDVNEDPGELCVFCRFAGT